MIKDALMALNENSGSSSYAIAKFMEQKFSAVLPANFRKILGLQLKNSVAKGKLIKIKASYKLSEIEQKKPRPKPTTEKRTTRKSEMEKKAAKKVRNPKRTRKLAPAKPKQPKSIRSSSAKKLKKATA